MLGVIRAGSARQEILGGKHSYQQVFQVIMGAERGRVFTTALARPCTICYGYPMALADHRKFVRKLNKPASLPFPHAQLTAATWEIHASCSFKMILDQSFFISDIGLHKAVAPWSRG